MSPRDLVVAYGALGMLGHLIVAGIDTRLRISTPSSVVLALLLFAAGGAVVGMLVGALVAWGRRRQRLESDLAGLPLLLLPVALLYVAILLNRYVLTSYSIRSPVAIASTLGAAAVLCGAAFLGARAINRHSRRAVPTLPRAAPLGWAALAIGVVAACVVLASPSRRVHTAASPTTGSAPEGAPNVIIFVSDCLRADHVSVSGYFRETTPTFDALAAAGVRFEDAHPAASWTLPSVVGMLTSMPAGIEMTPGGLSASVAATTLPEVLAAHGYATFGASNNPHLYGPFGLRDRFQTFEDGGSAIDDALDATLLGQLVRRLAGPSDRAIMDAVRDHLRELPQPYFAYVHIMGGHAPYEMPPGWEPPFDVPTAPREVTSPEAYMTISEEERASIIGRYDARVRYADELIGGVIDDLEERGHLDHTWIAYTGDHGEEFGEHEEWTHGQNLHTETVDVPLAIRFPGRVPPGELRSDVVSLIDLAPTILATVGGIEVPESFRGLNLFGEPPTGERYVVSELGPDSRALITDDWKYIVEVDTGREWLYDRRSDAAERTDIGATDTVTMERAHMAMTSFLEGATSAIVPSHDVEVSDDLAERLEALGYIEGH